ncbi:MAG: TlpA family protein disulfide reductase [Bacteroidetes bacterium]|nr:MAG: TlpA family protein disulfide reductase [Bacteroidota bacterium]
MRNIIIFSTIGLLTFFIIPTFCFSIRGKSSFIFFVWAYTVSGFFIHFLSKRKMLVDTLLLVLPMQVLLLIPIVGKIISPETPFNTTFTYEYIPMCWLSGFVGILLQNYFYKKKHYHLLIASVIWVSLLNIIFYMIPNYYFYFYTIETLNKNSKIPYNVSLIDLKKDTLSQKELTNKVIILDFWSSSCGSCIEQMADIIEIEKKFKKNKNVLFLTVNQSLHNTFKQFTESKHVELYEKDLIFVYDQGAKLANSLNVSAVPVLYLIDKEGFVRKRIKGYFDGEDNFVENLSTEINSLL